MTYSIATDDLEGLDSYWRNAGLDLEWPAVFILPPWLKAWWRVFGASEEICLRTVRQDGYIVGIAPMRKKGDAALFIGDIDVCDYLDFIVTPGRELDFFSVLVDGLERDGLRQLDLKYVRPDSFAMRGLVPLARERGYRVVITPEDVSVEMDLLADWNEYLESLSTKQRHEVKRKLRRLGESGDIKYSVIGDKVIPEDTLGSFFRMFIESRRDKAAFLTERREAFFRTLIAITAEAGLLRLGVLELDGKRVAQIICFDYNNCIYLYNSGYDPDYVSLSAGLISKVLAIKDSIEKGKRKFDFLKGQEIYKYHLGGKEIPLYRCLITMEN